MKIELRHARQAKLAELGADGQARIANVVARVGADGLASMVAAKYLAGAGVRAIVVTSEEARAFAEGTDKRVTLTIQQEIAAIATSPHFLDLENSARETAHGSWIALMELRRAIEER